MSTAAFVGQNIIDHDFNGIPTELYTSTHKLQDFFIRENYFIDQLRKIVNKKIMKYQTTENITKYITSFDDIVGSKQNDRTFMVNPLNAYHLVNM